MIIWMSHRTVFMPAPTKEHVQEGSGSSAIQFTSLPFNTDVTDVPISEEVEVSSRPASAVMESVTPSGTPHPTSGANICCGGHHLQRCVCVFVCVCACVWYVCVVCVCGMCVSGVYVWCV